MARRRISRPRHRYRFSSHRRAAFTRDCSGHATRAGIRGVVRWLPGGRRGLSLESGGRWSSSGDRANRVGGAHCGRLAAVSGMVAASVAVLWIDDHRTALVRSQGCGIVPDRRAPRVGRPRQVPGRWAGLVGHVPALRGSGRPGPAVGRTGPVALIGAAGSIPVRSGWRTDGRRWPVGRTDSPGEDVHGRSRRVGPELFRCGPATAALDGPTPADGAGRRIDR